MELPERMARAMLASLRPAHKGDPRRVDVDETDIDFVELAEIALNEILKGDEAAAEIERLRAAAKLALAEMCNTVAPRNSFTDAVDALDAALYPKDQ